MFDRLPEKPRAQFWLLQLAGWLVYGLVSALGALPYRNARPILLYFAGTTAAGFLASLPLRALCRRLMNAGPSWARIILVTIAASYVLGIACSLTGAIVEARFGQLDAHASGWRSVLLVGFSNAISPTIVLLAWGGIYFGAKHWQDMRQREQRLLLTESLARDAELRALRYQITPHFLFNTLNGISTLVGEGQTRSARRMIALLAEFLRSTLEPAERGDVTIAEELRQVRQYLAIEQVRLGDRMRVSLESAPELHDVLLPHLILQPLVENAIRHGIAPRLEGGTLALTVSAHGSHARIVIHNTYDPARAARRRGDAVSVGLGLANTAERLAARYGDAHRFSATGDPANGWRVVLDIPREDARERAA